MELRQIALEVARILQDAGKHALNDQMNPHDMRKLEVSEDCFHFTSDTDKRLQQFISNRLTYVNVFDGFWQLRPEQCYPGQRYWCVGGIDGVINFARSMQEWAITVTLFEFNDQCSAQPILSIVHAPALGLTYLAVRGSGAIRIRKTPLGDKREKIIPSTMSSLDGSVVSFGMSPVSSESQRADFLDEAVSSATTRSRPMVNTRDEPHADPDAFRRLHVIIGDSNRSQWATMMKLATTHLVLCVIEQAGREGRESGFSRFAFADAGAANRAVSRDMSGVTASFDMADGSTLQGGAVAMQERYLQAVEQFVDEHPEVASSLPRTNVHDVLRQWRNTLEAFRSGNANALGDRVDWVCKYRLFEALRARSSADLPLSKLEQLDLDYHDVANGALYASLLRRGALRSLIDGREAQKARTVPPADTRAALRGRFVSTAKSHGAQYSCDWTRLSLHAPRKMDMVLLDPFQCRENEDFQAMIGALE